MTKGTLLGFLAGVVGGLTAVVLTDRPAGPFAAAQEAPPFVAGPGSQLPQYLLEDPRGGPPVAHLPAAPNTPRGLPPLEDDDLTPEERINVAVYETANRSVVNIAIEVRAEALFIFEIGASGAGSGCVLDKSGHVLTNAHVVDGAHQIQVTLFDGQTYPARLVGLDHSTDVAVIKIEAPAESLYPVALGDSTRLKVGQRVFAIGNPFGLERTLTTGIISSLNRSLPARNGRTIRSIIQIDAAINPGNSGGPLLDSRARLIGMNTAIASKTGNNTGVGFAVPASHIGRVAPQLILRGKVIRPDVGILQVYQTENGLRIAKMATGGPAERAGLRGPQLVRDRRRQGPFSYESRRLDMASADLIVGVDGQETKTADEFLSLIESRLPGEQVTLMVVREGRELAIAVRLGESREAP